MKIYRGFPQRLHHTVPHWVEAGALFHIRIALDREKEQRPLTDPALAQVHHGESVLWRTIFDSAKFYEARVRWHITLFLVMPDHLHALLSFARNESMSEVIRDWKRFHARMNRVIWQEGYFDHRCARRRKTGLGLSIHLDTTTEEDDAKTIAEGARCRSMVSRTQKLGGRAALSLPTR